MTSAGGQRRAAGRAWKEYNTTTGSENVDHMERGEASPGNSVGDVGERDASTSESRET